MSRIKQLVKEIFIIFYPSKFSSQLKIANTATVSATDNTVTITIDNQKDEEFNFKVKKVKLDGSELNGSKFTIFGWAW